MLSCAVFLAATGIAFLGTYGIRTYALGRGWTSRKAEHHSHDGDIPRVGGIAIFGAVVASVIAGAVMKPMERADVLQLSGIIIATGCIFSIGLFDDLRPLRPWMKLAVEAGAGAVIFLSGIRIDSVGILPFVLPAWVSFLATVFWVMSLTNAYNLIDGLDGLAAGLGCVAAVTLALLAYMAGQPVAVILALGLAGALLGFLPFNYNPARIFMGDGGSLVVGALLSTIALLLSSDRYHGRGLVAAVVVFAIPVLDTILAIARRAVAGQSIFSPDCGHVHHQLLIRGYSIRKSAAILYVASLFFALSGAALVLNEVPPAFMCLILVVAITSGFFYLGYHYQFGFQERRRVVLQQASGKDVRQLVAAKRTSNVGPEEELRPDMAFASVVVNKPPEGLAVAND